MKYPRSTASRGISVSVASLLFLWVPNSWSGEREGVEALNTLLAKKPSLEYPETRWKTGCVWRRLPSMANGGEICVEHKYQETIYVPGPPQVQAAAVVRVSQLVFDEAQKVELPQRQRTHAAYLEYENCDNVNLTRTISLTVSGTKGWSVAKTEGISTTVGGSATVGASYAGLISASVTANFSQTISLSTTKSESFSETTTRNVSDTISIPPRTIGRYSILAYESTIEIPFSATIVIDGALRANRNGYNSASEFLTEEERTLPFKGVLRLTDTTQAHVKTEALPGKPQCKDNNVKFQSTTSTFSAPTSSIPKSTLSSHLPLAKLTRVDKTAILPQGRLALEAAKDRTTITGTLGSVVAGNGSTIGPADGTFYEILYTTEVSRPHVGCGFNDLGVPNGGIFLVEARLFRTYVNGEQVAQWTQNVENFVRCYVP